MSDLIDRQAALDALCDACTLASVKSECIFKNLESCMDHNAILDVPTIEERKKGNWIIEPYGVEGMYIHRCSECMNVLMVAPTNRPKYSYCPNCGADMRGEQDG